MAQSVSRYTGLAPVVCPSLAHGFALADLTWLPLYGSGSFVWSVLRSTHRFFSLFQKLFSNGLCNSADSLTDAIKALSLSFSDSSRAYRRNRRPSHKRRYKTAKPPTLSRCLVLFGPAVSPQCSQQPYVSNTTVKPQSLKS